MRGPLPADLSGLSAAITSGRFDGDQITIANLRDPLALLAHQHSPSDRAFEAWHGQSHDTVEISNRHGLHELGGELAAGCRS